MTDQALQYYLHHDPDALRLELSGSLSGDGAQSIYQAWRTALSIIGPHRVIVDITYVSEVDERGRRLLRLWRRSQARILAESPQSRALAQAVLEEPFPEPPAATSILQRASGFIRRLAASAGFPKFLERSLTVAARYQSRFRSRARQQAVKKLLIHDTSAGFPAAADARPSISAPALRQDADSSAPDDRSRLESRVPSRVVQLGIPSDYKGARKCFERG